ncbi:hypothetical protein MAGR_59620 [Mycolicibacterium agri]|uniref:Uncharacterized protein n=1 Tax=Mycolicibacterium agri TaxID=36811 RepID=A0A7I9W9Z4_MYCAG|nr:hypothetical protein MAGR_59620 [Mycolicibacterium agri]
MLHNGAGQGHRRWREGLDTAANPCKATPSQRPLSDPFHVPCDGVRQTRQVWSDTSATAANRHLLLCIVEEVPGTGNAIGAPAEQEACEGETLQTA